MKPRLIGLCLTAVCMLAGLTGCAGSDTNGGSIFLTGQTLSDDGIAMKMELATISDSIMAPMVGDNGNTMNRYYAQNGDVQMTDCFYLDCVMNVRNTGKHSIDLMQELWIYCNDGSAEFTDYMLLVESEDGTTLETPQELEAGQSVRAHYAIILPETVAWDVLQVSVVMPSSQDTYTAALYGLIPKTKSILSEDVPMNAANGAVLTLQSASVEDEISAITDAGGEDTIEPNDEDNVMVDVAIEVENTGSEPIPLHTLYGGQYLQGSFNALGVVAIEADDELSYSGFINAGDTAMTHLIFELPDVPTNDELFYLYLDGDFHAIAVEVETEDTETDDEENDDEETVDEEDGEAEDSDDE